MDNIDCKELSRRFYHHYDRNEHDAVEGLLHPDCRLHLPVAPTPLTREGFRALCAAFASAFIDSETVFEHQVAEGDLVYSHWTWSITHTGDFQGIAPTGRRIAISGATLNRFAQGQIIEQWTSFDLLHVMQALGAP
jgi:predicted ester cyclase